jgi:hypothetical protein
MKIQLILGLVFGLNATLMAQTWQATDGEDVFILSKINSKSLALYAKMADGTECNSTLNRISSQTLTSGSMTGFRKEFFKEQVSDTLNCKPWFKVGIIWFKVPAREDELVADFGFVVYDDGEDDEFDRQLYFYRK